MTEARAAQESLTILPESKAWAGLIRGAAVGSLAKRMRAQLGLPDGPVVMTGHQAEFWHPGILAKYLAAEAAARAAGARAAWVVVDQDDNDPLMVRVPVRNEGGRLKAVEAPIGKPRGASDAAGTPTGLRPPAGDVGERRREPEPVTDPARGGLRAVREAMSRRGAERSLAAQVSAALADCLGGLLAPAPTVFATALAGTDLFGEVMDRMAREPDACVRAYNAAAARHPGAGVRALVLDEVQDRIELPLWRLDPGSPRRRVFAEDLAGTPRERLAPRALLMTGLLRAAACDLFVHGLGGGAYDAVTDDWFRAWPALSGLAPTAVVTATRFLPMEGGAAEEAELVRNGHASHEAAVRSWAAHHARSDPAMLGERDAAARKMGLVGEIRAMKRGGRKARELRRDIYQRLQDLLRDVRGRHAQDLARLEVMARAAAGIVADAPVLLDRTWACPLYPRAVLEGLKAEVERSFGVGG